MRWTWLYNFLYTKGLRSPRAQTACNTGDSDGRPTFDRTGGSQGELSSMSDTGKPASQAEPVITSSSSRHSSTLLKATSIEGYRQFVADISKGELRSQVILNRTPEHAAIVLAALFSHAQKFVHIVSRKMSTDIYGLSEVIQAAVQFLKTHPEGMIHMLVEEAVDPNTHPLLSALNQEAPERVKLEQIPPLVRNTFKFNFAVADGQSYRFEVDREVREATIRFRDHEFGGDLEAAFQHILALSHAHPAK